MIPFVSSIKEAEDLSHGYGSIRHQSGSGQTQYPEGVVHRARDFFLPPGTKIYAPVSGIFDGWVPSNEDGSLGMGWIAKLIGDDGYYYRFVHLSVASQNKSLTRGMRIPVSTFLGATSLHNLGASDSHLHLDTTPGNKYVKDRRVDPLIPLGISGFNRMLGAGADTGMTLPGGFKLSIVGIAVGAVLLLGAAIYAGRSAAGRT